MGELIHSDFETIERPNQNYRITTRVEYRVARSNYQCRAILYKSRNGRPRFDRDKLYKSTATVSDEEDISRNLEDCIESCRKKLDEIEDAKDVSIEVSIDE